MERKDYIILNLIVFNIVIALLLGMFWMSVEGDKIDSCRELEHNRNEAYFECLEQNDLDTWTMANKSLHLKIIFGLWIFIALVPTELYGLIKAIDHFMEF